MAITDASDATCADGLVIRVSIERSEPLTGTAACGRGGPVHFVGWLDLLRAISELVEGDRHRAESPTATPSEPAE